MYMYMDVSPHLYQEPATRAISLLLPSNGNASETKENKSFGNGVFYYIEAKQTPSKSKIFLKRSENIR